MHRKVVVKTPVTKMTPSKNKAFNKDLDKYFDYFEIRKDKTPISSPECTFDSPDTVLHTYSGNPAIRINGLVDSPTGMTSGLPPLKTGGDSVNNSGVGGFAYVHSLNEALTPVNGAGSQRSSNIDKNTKKLMEAMQAKMIKLEQENRKLKKEVSDLSSQNKKLQTQVASFITEQENFAKVNFLALVHYIYWSCRLRIRMRRE